MLCHLLMEESETKLVVPKVIFSKRGREVVTPKKIVNTGVIVGG